MQLFLCLKNCPCMHFSSLGTSTLKLFELLTCAAIHVVTCPVIVRCLIMWINLICVYWFCIMYSNKGSWGHVGHLIVWPSLKFINFKILRFSVFFCLKILFTPEKRDIFRPQLNAHSNFGIYMNMLAEKFLSSWTCKCNHFIAWICVSYI